MMADSPKNAHITVPIDLLARLKARRQSHQALAGVIEDLLTEVENSTSIIKGSKTPDISSTTIKGV